MKFFLVIIGFKLNVCYWILVFLLLWNNSLIRLIPLIMFLINHI